MAVNVGTLPRICLILAVALSIHSTHFCQQTSYPWLWTTLAAIVTWMCIGGYHTIYIAYHTLPRDLRAARMMIRLSWLIKTSEWKDWTVPKMFEETAKRNPDKPMLIFEDKQWTFKDVDQYSNKIGNYFLSKGYSKGDSVALFMENRPEFVAIWLGLSKIGAVPALINSNLRKKGLIHSIEVAQCKALIFGAELFIASTDVRNSLGNGRDSFPLFCSGSPDGAFEENLKASNCVNLDAQINLVDSNPVSPEVRDSIHFKDKLMYIYTSGTTGLPKAAIIKHSRYILASGGSVIVIGCRHDDTIYSPLPLYHSVAGMISLAGTMKYGITMVMRKKFSASNYWKDCLKYNVTVGQYIGEVCRYLLNCPECPEEKSHKIRLMFGNGLRPQIWTKFTERFNIPNIAEFYGSTEGNSQIINIGNRVGAVGFLSILFHFVFPMGLIRVHEASGDEIRDKNGLCVPCDIGEPGEFVGKIVRNHPIRDFHGYANQDASKKKVINNVFQRGDTYFRSGDILVMDKFGWLYFKDRSGDTFRWKGENVSTTEVEAVISELAQLQDAVAYGVEIPGCDGKAGMVAISDPEEKIDLINMAAKIEDNLPPYARPLFLRLAESIEKTGTLKLKKFNLQKEGFDINVVKDKIYFFHPKSKTFEYLDNKLYQEILNHVIRL